MKKRLLALILCLVLVTSLLPVTAAAAEWHSQVFVGLKDGGVYCEDVQFELHPENFPAELNGFGSMSIAPGSGSGGMVMTPDGDGKYTLHVNAGAERPTFTVNHKGGLNSSGPSVTLKNGHNWSAWTSNGDGTHSRTCGNGCVDSPQKDFCADNVGDCKCDDCGASMHTWQFTQTENTLTAECQKHDTPPVSVTLKADSVTLPKSPFNARLEGWEQFKEAFPMVSYEKLVYKYNGPNGWSVVEPTAANAKAGQYQVGVRIENLPGPVESDGPDGPVAMAENQDGTYTADLYVQYTAADPAITAQTGDNRPIELMMVSVLVFSALAVAAFILDSKRKNASL